MATETVESRRGSFESNARLFDEVPNVGLLPIPDLRVSGFRGFEQLAISRFGRVSLVVGKNGVGKTTLLEALKVFASRFSASVLAEVMTSRRELVFGRDEDGDPIVDLDWESLFWGRHVSPGQRIVIGSETMNLSLRMSVATIEDMERDGVEPLYGPYADRTLAFKVVANDGPSRYIAAGPSRHRFQNRRRGREYGFPKEIPVTTLGPEVIEDDGLAQLWDGLIDSGGSKMEVVESLSKMYGKRVDDIDMVGDRSRHLRDGRRAKVRLFGNARPVPLKSLGDGAMRIVGHLTAAAQSGESLLLIDEIENGIHHEIQSRFWRTLIDAAVRYETQVIATTHSWDAVESFAVASSENEDADCAMVRIDELEDGLWVTEYRESDLLAAAQHGIEVR